MSPVYFSVDVVAADVPALIGMDSLEKNSCMDDTVTSRCFKRVVLRNEQGVSHMYKSWSLPHCRDERHIYIP